MGSFKEEVEKMWEVNARVAPVVIGVLGSFKIS